MTAYISAVPAFWSKVNSGSTSAF